MREYMSFRGIDLAISGIFYQDLVVKINFETTVLA